MKRFLQFAVFLIIGLAVFAVVFWKVGFSNILQALRLFFNKEGFLIIILSILASCLGIARWQVVLKSQGKKFSFKTLTSFWLMGYTFSYLSPFTIFGGEPAKAYLLKKKFPDISWEQSAASVAIDKIIDTTVFFIFIVAGLFSFSFFGVFPGSLLAGGTVIVLAVFIALLALFYFKSYKKESAIEWLLSIFDIRIEKLQKLFGIKNPKGAERVLRTEAKALRFFSFKKKRFWQALALTILRYVFLFAKAYCLTLFLTGSFDVFKALAIFSFVNLAGLTPMPANLGSLELGQGLAFACLGFGFGVGTVFSLIWRASELVLCFFGGWFAIQASAGLLREKILNRFKA